MRNRTTFAVLAVVLFATAAFGGLDVATEIESPRSTEPPGLVSVRVKLTNNGSEDANVPRLDVKIDPSGYLNYFVSIRISVGESQTMTFNPWVCPAGSEETCTAWITYEADTNHSNDTDVVIVNAAGISGSVETQPRAVMDLTLSPSPLAGNVLHVEYSLSKVGPARVSLFDVSGRAAVVRDFTGSRRGELPLDLRHVRGGVYLVRLDDGRSAVTRKLVVQR